MKKLFVLCDGTWQDGTNNKGPITNVATLARCLRPSDSHDNSQLVYYDGGVGNVTSIPAQFIDGATGRGISVKIRNAYSFLSHNYDFIEDQDEIILVGFSQGAFAVQCLASLISQTGLLEKQYLYYLRGLFTLWTYQKVGEGLKKLETEIERLFKSKVLHKVKITTCAVWDTVSTLGMTTQLPPQPLSFVGTTVPIGLKYAFQALALDEKRRKFKPCVWDTKEVGKDQEDRNDAVMIGKLHDNVGVRFNEDEIVKHLKHKYFEWDFVVSKLFASFKETRSVSSMPHTGQAGKPSWVWLLLGFGWKPRAGYLMPVTLNQPLRQTMEVHFSVRIAMSSGRNECASLATWKTVKAKNGVEWQSRDKLHTLKEHLLKKNIGMEYKLLKNWCEGMQPPNRTDRDSFVSLQVEVQQAIQEPASELALDKYRTFLRAKMVFDRGDLAPDAMYSS